MAQVKKISKKNIFLLATASFFILGVIFFSLAVQKYQVLTSSRATGGNQCTDCSGSCSNEGQFCEQPTGKCADGKKEIIVYKCESGNWVEKYPQAGGSCPGNNECGKEPTPGKGTPTPSGAQPTTAPPSGNWNQCNSSSSNKPCGSCDIKSINVDSGGSATVGFGCQLLCEPGNCPSGTYQINDTSWFWCEKSDGSSCTQGSDDLKANVHNTTSVGSLTVSDTSPNATNNGFNWSFTIPNWTNCGRVQVDVQINAQGVNVAGDIKGFGSDCTEPSTPPNTPPPNSTPTNTPPPNSTPTKTPTVPNTPTKTPTNTPTSTPTKTPTPEPTDAPLPTETPTPTDTPVLTETPVPPTPTTVVIAQAPTNTPVPPTPTPTTVVIAQAVTPTPVQKLAVEDQPPGITPWSLILIPMALLLLGLLL